MMFDPKVKKNVIEYKCRGVEYERNERRIKDKSSQYRPSRSRGTSDLD